MIGDSRREAAARLEALETSLVRFKAKVTMSNRRIAEKLYRSWRVALLKQSFRAWSAIHRDRQKVRGRCLLLRCRAVPSPPPMCAGIPSHAVVHRLACAAHATPHPSCVAR